MQPPGFDDGKTEKTKTRFADDEPGCLRWTCCNDVTRFPIRDDNPATTISTDMAEA